MSLSPKPTSLSDGISKSRDVAGVGRLAKSQGIISIFMLILGWFTIPVEVFLRRDFGQRWFTTINFYVGLILLWVIATTQILIHFVGNAASLFFDSVVGTLFGNNPDPVEPPPLDERIMNTSMSYVLNAYLILGILHRLTIWWRDRTGTARHSYYDGTSNITGIGNTCAETINDCTRPFIWIFIFVTMSKERRKSLGLPKLINDTAAFNHTVVEPLLLIIIASVTHGILSLWLYISSVAYFIYSSLRESAKRDKMLDLRDSAMEAATMRQLREEMAKPVADKTPKKGADKSKEVTKPQPQATLSFPDLQILIDDMNKGMVDSTP